MDINSLLSDSELISEIASALRSAEARKGNAVCRENCSVCKNADCVCRGAELPQESLPASALISALKPFLSPHRCEKAETLLKILSAAEIYKGLKSARKER